MTRSGHSASPSTPYFSRGVSPGGQPCRQVTRPHPANIVTTGGALKTNEGRQLSVPTVQLTDRDMNEMIARANRTLDAVADCSKAFRRMADDYDVFFAIWPAPRGTHGFLALKGQNLLSRGVADLSAFKWSAIACANAAEAQKLNEFLAAREAGNAEARAGYERSYRRITRAPPRTK